MMITTTTKHGCSVPLVALRNVLRRVANARGLDSTRWALAGVEISIGGQFATITASDGRRVHSVTVRHWTSTDPFRVLLGKDAVDALLKSTASQGVVQLTDNDVSWKIKGKKEKRFPHSLSRFPGWSQLFDDCQESGSVWVSADSLAAATEPIQGVHLGADGLSTDRLASCGMKVSGRVDLHVDIELLHDVATVCDGTVEFSIQSADKAIVVHGNDDFRALLMPMSRAK